MSHNLKRNYTCHQCDAINSSWMTGIANKGFEQIVRLCKRCKNDLFISGSIELKYLDFSLELDYEKAFDMNENIKVVYNEPNHEHTHV